MYSDKWCFKWMWRIKWHAQDHVPARNSIQNKWSIHARKFTYVWWYLIRSRPLQNAIWHTLTQMELSNESFSPQYLRIRVCADTILCLCVFYLPRDVLSSNAILISHRNRSLSTRVTIHCCEHVSALKKFFSSKPLQIFTLPSWTRSNSIANRRMLLEFV